MAYDLAVAANGDLIFGGNNDLAGVSGIDLIKQRMRIRLRVARGEWVYDEDKTLGSNLQNLLGMSAQDAHTAVEPYVREALRPMDNEISILNILHQHIDLNGVITDEHNDQTRGIVITVEFAVQISPDEIFAPSQNTVETFSLSFQI